MTATTYYPVLPSVSVEKIETQERLEEIAVHFKEKPELYLNVRPDNLVSLVEVQESKVVVPKRPNLLTDPDAPPRLIVLFQIGDILVESANRRRVISNNEELLHGRLSSLPIEIFAPDYGHVAPRMS